MFQKRLHGFESRWSPDFFRLLLSNCLNWKIHCDDHSSLLSITAVQNELFHILHINIYFLKKNQKRSNRHWVTRYVISMVYTFIDHSSRPIRGSGGGGGMIYMSMAPYRVHIKPKLTDEERAKEKKNDLICFGSYFQQLNSLTVFKNEIDELLLF